MTQHQSKPIKIHHEDGDDLLSVYLNADPTYTRTKQQAYSQFQQHYKTQHNYNFFTTLSMTTKQLLFRLTHSTVALALLAVVAFGSVSTFALENLAPTDYKPSTIIQKTFNPEKFKSNKQSDANPYTALVPDANNDVAASSFCDLAVKYPKTFDGQEVTIYRDQITFDGVTQETIAPAVASNGNTFYNTVYINCYGYDLNSPATIEFNQRIQEGYYGSKVDNAVQYIQDNLGWFLTQKEDATFNLYQDKDLKNHTVEIINGNRRYIIQLADLDLYPDGFALGGQTQTDVVKEMKGNEIQVQFNSITENKLSTEILQKEDRELNKTVSGNATLTPEQSKSIEEFNKIAKANLALVTLKPKDTNLLRTESTIDPESPLLQTCSTPGLVHYYASYGGDAIEASYTMGVVSSKFSGLGDFDRITNGLNNGFTFDMYDNAALASLTNGCENENFTLLREIKGIDKGAYDSMLVYSTSYQFVTDAPNENKVIIIARKGDQYTRIEGTVIPANTNYNAEFQRLAVNCGAKIDAFIMTDAAKQCLNKIYQTQPYQDAQKTTAEKLLQTFAI